MGNRGRYGKYGEIKRLAHLRKGRSSPSYTTGLGIETVRRSARYKRKSFSRDQVKITAAGVTDEGYIRSLSKRVFNRYGPYDDTLVRWFGSGGAVTIMASTDKRPLGFALLGRSAHGHPFSCVYEILAIAVEPEMHGLGIGSLLLDDLEKKAKGLQAEKLILHTAVINPHGRKFFKKHGFITAETNRNFYPEGQDALMMYKEVLQGDKHAADH